VTKKAQGLTIATSTDPGVIRPNNEDRIAITPEAGLAVVADGMGGHQAGEVASGMAVELITHHIIDVLSRDPQTRGESDEETSKEYRCVSEAIDLANSAIFERAQSAPQCAGMGTTIVVTLFYDDKVCIGHVGDSRLYLFRGNKLELLTEDHSLVQELVSRGLITPEEARASVNKNLVTRALGIEPTVGAQIIERPVKDKDLYLLCSDGLNDVLPDTLTASILKEAGNDLQQAAARMVAEVNARGGPDNVSVILVRTAKRFTRDQVAIAKLGDELKG
jgi:PPM family protein phosphatase